MRLTDEVVVAAPSDTVFHLLADVGRVAPCLPGATLEGGSGPGSYQGRVKVKVGPIAATYHGTARMMEVDEATGRIVVDARGADQHGGGNAEARVEVRVRPHAAGCALTLDTDLVIRGKVAQFGRGAITDVSQKLMEQFARNVETLLDADVASALDAGAFGASPALEGGEGATVDSRAPVAAPLLERVAAVVALAAAVAAVAAAVVALRRRGIGIGPSCDRPAQLARGRSR